MMRLRKVYKGEASWQDLIDVDRLIDPVEKPINEDVNKNKDIDISLNDLSDILMETQNKGKSNNDKPNQNNQDDEFILENVNNLENENDELYNIMYENENEDSEVGKPPKRKFSEAFPCTGKEESNEIESEILNKKLLI